MKTLIMLDMQNDFMPDGSLAVPSGDVIVPIINKSLKHFDLIVATQDWHPSNHISFASNHSGKKAFDVIRLGNEDQTLWPDHCVQGTYGAEFHPQLNSNAIETVFRKGTASEIDSYSGFYDNYHQKSTGLAGYLREKGAQDLYFCGLCADICVYFTINDAYSEGFNCCLLENATCALDPNKLHKIKNEFYSKKIRIMKTDEL